MATYRHYPHQCAHKPATIPASQNVDSDVDRDLHKCQFHSVTKEPVSKSSTELEPPRGKKLKSLRKAMPFNKIAPIYLH